MKRTLLIETKHGGCNVIKYGLVGLTNSGCPSDEYEPEAKTIIGKLKQGMTAEDIATLVESEFVFWFFRDLVPLQSEYDYIPMANEILEVYNNQ